MMEQMAARRNRRTFREIFLDKLGELSKGGSEIIANIGLRDALRWDEVRYKEIKEQLRAERLIIVGRGRGGTVGLADATGSKGLSVFVSYSHVDQKLKEELLKHLKPLERMKLVEA